jgi:uracil-DNA glycosylase family 4
MQQLPDPRLVALLQWWRDMGVTDVFSGEPEGWLAAGSESDATAVAAAKSAGPMRAEPAGASKSAPTPPAPAPPRAFPVMPPAAAEQAASSEAAAARTLEELKTRLQRFEGCALKATAKNLCFYRGSPRARLMIIGEAPGREEDLEGKPFVGRAGKLLDRMLAAIGLTENDVHITNIVYWRPPGNRTPTPQEALVCRPFLLRQIELVSPDILLLLGGAAAKQVLGVTDGILRLRGKWREVEVAGRRIPAMATLHPAYLLRTPASKRLAWRDLLAVRARLNQPQAGGGKK